MGPNKTRKIEKYEDFYIKLRKKIINWIDNNKIANEIHGWTGNFLQYLFLLPDFVYLLIQLLKDKKVQVRYKTMIICALTYVVFPLDIIPDFIPVIGFIDDLLVVVIILNKIINTQNQNMINKLNDYWVGEGDILEKVKEILQVMNSLAAKIPQTILNFMGKGNSKIK